ncbi:MAG: coenzyme F420-0:L-glutamate ligase [Candidatus Dormibacteraeota bacterium]|nr:coenzyme F420-0:L-glutamate ligase [Candidatus Dormibacteraeota bacterium]
MIQIYPVHFEAEISEGDDLTQLIRSSAPAFLNGDVVVVSQKAVSKAEGQIVELAGVEPSPQALELAGDHSDPRVVEVILRESVRVVRHRGPLLITETHHGFVCASAGVDRSNAPRPDTVVLLPKDSDASAAALRRELEAATHRRLAVIIADTMGRPLRDGIVGTAIGVSGLEPLLNLSGLVDPNNYAMMTTVVAVADELAAAADLVIGKIGRIPAAVVRGFAPSGDGSARQLIRDRATDLFV